MEFYRWPKDPLSFACSDASEEPNWVPVIVMGHLTGAQYCGPNKLKRKQSRAGSLTGMHPSSALGNDAQALERQQLQETL